MSKLWKLLLAAALLCPAARAQTVEEWEPVAPPSSPTGPISDTPEGGFSNSERIRLIEKLRERVLDQLCRQVKLKYDYNFGQGDFSGTGVGMARYLAQYPSSKLAIVDEETIRVGAGHTFPWEIAEGVTAGFWIGSRIEGKSMVVRPIEGVKTCSEVDRLIDLRDIKTVFPFNQERVQAMKVGELWRLPFSLMIGYSLSAGAVVAENLPVSIGFTSNETGTSALTLYRVADDQLRFRFRVDRAEVRIKSANITQSIPAVDFPIEGANLLMKFIDKEIAKQLRDYTTASLGWAYSKTNGKQVVLEYVVDPRDPVQAAAVVKAVRGDIRDLVVVGLRLASQQATDESTRAFYEKLQADHDAALGAAKYASMNEYMKKARSLRLHLPFLMDHSWGSGIGTDRTTRLNDDGGQFLFNNADKTRNSEYFDIPWVGPLVKDNSQRTVTVLTQAPQGGPHGGPMAVYIENHAYLRTTQSTIRERVEDYNEILRLTGTRGRGAAGRYAIPTDRYIPPPVRTPAASPRRGEPAQMTEPGNLKGFVTMTLALNQKAVADILAASAEDVARAIIAAAGKDSQAEGEWLLGHSSIAEDGTVDYNRNHARRAFGGNDPFDRRSGNDWSVNRIASLARATADFVQDLADARNAPDNEARAAAIAKLVAGKARTDMAYEDVMKVLVQFVDPLDLTGDFQARVDRSKKQGGDLNVHLALRKDRPANEMLRAAGDAKNRFAVPSILLD